MQQQPPLQGTYEIIPSTCTVTAYKFVPTIDTPLTENCGENTGVVSAQLGKHRRWLMLQRPLYGLAVLPNAGVKVMSAG